MRDLIVKIALKLGLYKKLVDLDTYFINRKKVRNFQKNGVSTFIHLDEVCRNAGVQMIPIFGTQLGLYRDHGFIPFDNDIDVAVLASQRPADFVKILADAGFKLETVLYFKEDGREVIEQYECNHVHVDIFNLFDLSEEDYYCYVGRRHETKEWKEANRTDGFPCVIWPFTKCDMIEQEYFGHRFYMPEKSEEWLKGVFGEDFMIPVKDWTVGERKTRIIYPKERLYRRFNA
jgi:hypothetical protein